MSAGYDLCLSLKEKKVWSLGKKTLNKREEKEKRVQVDQEKKIEKSSFA